MSLVDVGSRRKKWRHSRNVNGEARIANGSCCMLPVNALVIHGCTVQVPIRPGDWMI